MQLINDSESIEDRIDFVECRACERVIPRWDTVEILDDEHRKCVCCDCVTLYYQNDPDCTASHAAELAIAGTRTWPNPKQGQHAQAITKQAKRVA